MPTMETLTIKVTDEDIAESRRRLEDSNLSVCRHCPTAVAIERAGYGSPFVSFMYVAITSGREAKTYRLSPELRDQIDLFTSNRDFHPGIYTATLIETSNED